MFDADEAGKGASGQLRSERKLHILWANRRREDCIGGGNDLPPTDPVPPKPTWFGLFTEPKLDQSKSLCRSSQVARGAIVEELEQLKQRYPGQITIEYFVNEEDTWIDANTLMKALSRFDDKDFSAGTATRHEQRQIIISGPGGYITYLAGPNQWRNGREEQGVVSRIIAHALSQNPHRVMVWKIRYDHQSFVKHLHLQLEIVFPRFPARQTASSNRKLLVGLTSRYDAASH